MPSINTISPDKLERLIGTPKCPVLVDVRTDEDFSADPRLIPGARRHAYDDVESWSGSLGAAGAVVICQRGLKLSQGTGALLRHAGVPAEVLEGGFQAWKQTPRPLISAEKLPPRDKLGRTIWVTRERPKVDRIACPWLIKRFVDPAAVFLFVAPSEVEAVAERFGGAPFDIDGVHWSHRGDRCTFDTMLDEFGISTEPLQRLATIVRGADTARPDLAPEAAGLLAVSLGLSRMYADDLEQLEAGLVLYDALFRWCRDATGETHAWHTAPPRKTP